MMIEDIIDEKEFALKLEYVRERIDLVETCDSRGVGVYVLRWGGQDHGELNWQCLEQPLKELVGDVDHFIEKRLAEDEEEAA